MVLLIAFPQFGERIETKPRHDAQHNFVCKATYHADH